MNLEDILCPVTVEQFASRYWGKEVLHVRGNPDKFSSIFSLDRLEESLLQFASSPGFGSLLAHVSYDHGRTLKRIDPAEVLQHFRSGGAVCVSNLDSVDNILSTLGATVRDRIGFLGKVDFRAYLSADDQGFDTHFDARIATTLQIAGKKLWKFSTETALEWPTYQVFRAIDGTLITSRPIQRSERYRPPSECSFHEVTLEPGDVLCLPAGTWHSAEADGFSLALNMAFGIESGFWTRFAGALGWIVSPHAMWRQPAPLVYQNYDPRDGLPPPVTSFLCERIDELVDTLQELKTTPWALETAWKLITNPIVPSAPPAVAEDLKNA